MAQLHAGLRQVTSATVPIKMNTDWAPVPVRALCSNEESLTPTKIRTTVPHLSNP
jgi:hypothetical protein